MASGWYNSGLRDMADRTIDLVGDTIKIMLVGAGYTPNPDHDFVDDVVAAELSGTGYTGGFGGSGRKTLAGKAFSTDTGNDRVEYTFDQVTWAAINAGTAAYAIVIKEITNDAASRLIGYLDLVPDVVTNGGDFNLTPDAVLGALQLAVA
jgi:hypothetical protein